MQAITLENKAILVTGAAGFIGSNLVKRLLADTLTATIIEALVEDVFNKALVNW